MNAPVRAMLTCTMGDIGVLIQLTVVSDHVLIVVDPITAVDDEITVPGETQLIFAHTTDIWAILSAVLPPIDCLRAPATPISDATPAALNLTAEQCDTLFDREQANLHAVVEAWDQDTQLGQWGYWWSVVDNRLHSICVVDGHLSIQAWQPGAIASTLLQTVTAAIEAIEARAGDAELVSASVADTTAV